MDGHCLFHQPTESHTLHSETESLSSHLPLCAVIDEKNAFLFRRWLKSKKFEDDRRTSRKIIPSSVAIPVNDDFLSTVQHQTSVDGSYNFDGFRFELQNIDLRLKSSRLTHSAAILVKDLSCLKHPKFSWNKSLKRDLPNSWERHGDLILLPEQCFLREEWTDLGVDLWRLVASAFRCSRIAKRGRIMNNGFRSPAVTLLLGSNGWVEHVDNKIRYRYDVTKCMFSTGNITEKIRIAQFNCEGETVVDLFAGIGYFTLPYLVHARASLVYGCEWNPDAVEALKANLALNGVADRCIVLQGDNRQSCPKGVADRVNLGLIPSSEESWDTACAALKPEFGGILHVHGNITSRTPETTKPNTCHQTPTLDTDSRVNVTDTPPDDKELTETSCHMASEFGEGKSSVVIDERKSHDATCDTSDSEEINNTFHPTSNNSTTFKVLQALQTFEMPSDNLLSKTTHTETNVTPAHQIGGAVAYPAVNYTLPANQRFSADGQNEGHNAGKRCVQNHPKSTKTEWVDWASQVCQKLKEILRLQTSKQWQTTVIHIEHVKSYAPHIDHIVADIRCSPDDREVSNETQKSPEKYL